MAEGGVTNPQLEPPERIMTMKIIDENGVELTEAPDLTLGRLIDDAEIVHHEATEAVKKVCHYVTTKTYPNGSAEVEEVVDVAPVAAKPAWDETVPVQRYVRYTADELAEMEAERQKQAALDTLPETVAALQSAQTDTDSLMVDQEYRLTLLELGLTPEA